MALGSCLQGWHVYRLVPSVVVFILFNGWIFWAIGCGIFIPFLFSVVFSVIVYACVRLSLLPSSFAHLNLFEFRSISLRFYFQIR